MRERERERKKLGLQELVFRVTSVDLRGPGPGAESSERALRCVYGSGR